MGRQNAPWFRADRGFWSVTIKGKRYNLGKDEEAATREFHRLMSLDEPVVIKDEILCVELLDKFLVWTQKNKASATYDWYYKHLQSFLKALPNKLIEASQIKQKHVTEWVKADWSPTYARGAMTAVQRAYRWGVTQGHIDKPLGLEKPSAERRDNCPTKADVEALLSHAKGCFRDFIEFIIETGCRPQEAVAILPKYVQADKVVFPVKESKGKKNKRVIYLTKNAKQILDANGGRFLNREGNPWTAYSIDCRLKRISKKTGKKFSAYDLRHYTATRWLEAGLDHLTASKLLGHRDVTILSRVYAHIGENSDFLLTKLQSIN